MSLIRSLTSGSSSLKAHQQKFDTISNNLANANTIGFKQQRTTFADQLSQMVKYGKAPDSSGGQGSGGINPSQVGLGVKVGAIQTDMSQGALEMTNRPLDMALNGDGFFMYNLNGRELYSRAGAVIRDTQGMLVDASSGAYLQGYNLAMENAKISKDSLGNNILDRKLANVSIPPGIVSQPRQTQNITFAGNLNSETNEGDIRSTSIKIFDNFGGARNLTLSFEKTATANQFNLTAELDGKTLTLPAAASTLTFNADGTLQTPLDFEILGSDLNTSIGGNLFDSTKNLKIRLADPNSMFNNSMTQFASPSNATALTQDGYQTGDLLGLEVDTQGKVWGSFTNGQSEVVAQVGIAKFTNPEAMVKEGGNFYSQSANSGLPNRGTAAETFPSTTITGRALEQSNVDLTEQFTDLISTQRAFEAASRTVTISDQFLQETVNLKR